MVDNVIKQKVSIRLSFINDGVKEQIGRVEFDYTGTYSLDARSIQSPMFWGSYEPNHRFQIIIFFCFKSPNVLYNLVVITISTSQLQLFMHHILVI